MPIDIDYTTTPFGELIVGSSDEKLCLCDWRNRKARSTINRRLSTVFETTFKQQNNKTIELCTTPLDEYFAFEKRQFELPIILAGTDFQKSV